MTSSAKRKGSGFEREVVKLLQEGGIAAEKVPLSGAVKGGSFEGDVDCPIKGVDHKLECKRRRRGFATIYGWMQGVFALCVRDDHCEPLVVIRLKDFIPLIK